MTTISIEDFKWALAVVDSRAFEIDHPGKGSSQPCLAPALDLMNHRRPRMTSYSFKPTETKGGNLVEQMTITTLLPASRGCAVDITYGAKGNAQLLQRYGFTLRANTEPDGSCNNTVVVKFQQQTPSSEEGPTRANGNEAHKREAGAEDGISRETKRLRREDPLQTTAEELGVAGNVPTHSTCAVELRLASESAPKHYVFTPFTKALDACRAILSNAQSVAVDRKDTDRGNEKADCHPGNNTMDDFLRVEAFMMGGCQKDDGDVANDDDDDDDDEDEGDDGDNDDNDDENSGGDSDDDEGGDSDGAMLHGLSNTRMVECELSALNLVARTLRTQDSKYEHEHFSVGCSVFGGDPQESGPCEASVVDCARVVRSERTTLRFYACIAELAASVLVLPTDEDSSWLSAAAALFKSADEHAESELNVPCAAGAVGDVSSGGADAETDPLFHTLMPLSVVVKTYLQVKFQVRL